MDLVIGFGPNLGLALWPRAKPINILKTVHIIGSTLVVVKLHSELADPTQL